VVFVTHAERVPGRRDQHSQAEEASIHSVLRWPPHNCAGYGRLRPEGTQLRMTVGRGYMVSGSWPAATPDG
jgi:hypothetical protein